jgi:hypothetical protein
MTRQAERRKDEGSCWNDRRQAERRISPAIGEFAILRTPTLYAEIDRLRTINAELVEALHDQIRPRAKGWKVADWDIRDSQAHAAIAKATQS